MVNHRPSKIPGIEWIAELQSLRDVRESLGITVYQRFVNDDAARGYASLPCRLESRNDSGCHGQIEPGIVADDHRILTAHLRGDQAIRHRCRNLLNSFAHLITACKEH